MLKLIFPLVMACAVHTQEVIWVRNGETADAHFGQSIYPLGDENEDGYADWMVSASSRGGTRCGCPKTLIARFCHSL